MYNETIKKILRQLEIMPVSLLIKYLMETCNLNEKRAEQSIYAALRSGICYKVDDNNVAITKFKTWDSAIEMRMKAFRVLMQLSPEGTDFTIATYPWLISFIKDNNHVLIGSMDKGEEYAKSSIYAQQAVPEDMRQWTRRIAIIEPGFNYDLMQNAGFIYFCEVDEDYTLRIVNKIDDVEEAWADVAK